MRKYFPDAADLIPAERHRATRRPAVPAADDSDDEEKEAEKMKEELKRVKKERVALLQALAAARGESHGRPAGDLQSQDIAALRTSLSEKQQMLNELREQNAELERRYASSACIFFSGSVLDKNNYRAAKILNFVFIF